MHDSENNVCNPRKSNFRITEIKNRGSTSGAHVKISQLHDDVTRVQSTSCLQNVELASIMSWSSHWSTNILTICVCSTGIRMTRYHPFRERDCNYLRSCPFLRILKGGRDTLVCPSRVTTPRRAAVRLGLAKHSWPPLLHGLDWPGHSTFPPFERSPHSRPGFAQITISSQ